MAETVRGLAKQTMVAATSVLIIGLAIVVRATPAGACSCVGVSDDEAYAMADAAFVGTLVEIIPPALPTGSSGDPERFVFDVEEVFKGDVRARQTVVTHVDGATCGLELAGPGPFLVFASTDSPFGFGVAEGELSSDLCSGSRLLGEGDPPDTFGTSSPPEGAAAASPSEAGGGVDPRDDASGVGAGEALGLAVGAAAVAAVGAVVVRRRAS